MRAPRKDDAPAVRAALGALAALGPGATTARVVEKLGLRRGSMDTVRALLRELEGGGVVSLALVDATAPTAPPTAWEALAAAQVALENAALALTAAQEAVKAVLAKQRKPAPRAATPTAPRAAAHPTPRPQ